MRGRIYKEAARWVIKYDNPDFNIDGVGVKSIEIHPDDVEDLAIIAKHAGYNEIKGDEVEFELREECANYGGVHFGRDCGCREGFIEYAKLK